MRAWFTVGALILGLIGFWGQQDPAGRAGRTASRSVEGGGPAKAMDGGSTIPTPKAP